MKTTILLFTIAVYLGKPSVGFCWTEQASLIGKRIDSKDVLSVIKTYGAAISVENGWHFEQRGLSFIFEDRKIKEVLFQIAPGKRIADIPYRGVLPKGVFESRTSPEKAFSLIGKPSFDRIVDGGYRVIDYEVEDKIMILYYGPQLDYVSLRLKIAEPVNQPDS